MALAYEKIMGFKIPDAEQHLTRKDTMLYALGVGLGADPCDTNQLKFVYEKNLEALPTMAIILGYAGSSAGSWHAKHPRVGHHRDAHRARRAGFPHPEAAAGGRGSAGQDPRDRRVRQRRGQGRAHHDREHRQ
jgi:hypothetical protein